MTTLRRELRLRFTVILMGDSDTGSPAIDALAERLADAALEVRGIAMLATDETPGQYNERKPDMLDAILDQERQAVGKVTYPKREALPEAIRELIDEFVRASGIKPISKDMLNWLQAGNDWLEIGAQVKDIAPAYLQAKEKYTVYSPHSITKELQRYKAQPQQPAKTYDQDYL